MGYPWVVPLEGIEYLSYPGTALRRGPRAIPHQGGGQEMPKVQAWHWGRGQGLAKLLVVWGGCGMDVLTPQVILMTFPQSHLPQTSS